MARGGAGPAGWGARRRGRRAWRAGGATWCTKTRYPLFLRSLCTKSRAFLRPWPAPTWCTKSCRPCSSVSFAPSPPRFFARGRRRLGARNPAGPCSSVSFAPSPARFFARGRRQLGARNPAALVLPFPLHQFPRVFSPVAGADLVHEIPRVLISPFPLHQFPRISSPVAGRAWCLTARYPLFLRLEAPRPRAQQRFPPGGRGASPLAIPCSFVLGHHVLEHSSRSRRTGVVPHRPLTLVSSSWGTTSSSTAVVPAGRAWCLTAR